MRGCGSEHDRSEVLDGFGRAPDIHPRALSEHVGRHPAHSSTTQHVPDPGHPGVHSPPLRQPPEMDLVEERIPEQRLSDESRRSRRGRTAARGDRVPDFEEVPVKDGQRLQGGPEPPDGSHVQELHVIIQAVHLAEEIRRQGTPSWRRLDVEVSL